MRIGELARTLGTDPPTIRYYEEIGILPAPQRSENRYREYGDEDVRRLGVVFALRHLDVPIDEIRTPIDDGGPHARTRGYGGRQAAD